MSIEKFKSYFDKFFKEYPAYELINYIGLILISSALWNIDFSVNTYVGIPLVYHGFIIAGVQLYMLSFILIFIISFVFLWLNKSYHLLLFLFVFAISLNFILFISFKFNYLSIYYYGLEWNDILFFIAYPALVLFLFLNSYKRKSNSLSK